MNSLKVGNSSANFCGLRKVVTTALATHNDWKIVSTYGKKAAKRLESMLREYGKSHAEFAAYCKSVIRRKRNGSGSGGSVKGFFSKSVGFFKRQFRKE